MLGFAHSAPEDGRHSRTGFRHRGFNGTDPAPTLTQFQALVHTGQIRYFLGAATGRETGSGSDQSRQIATWVAATYPSTTVDAVTIYTLTP